MHETKTSIRSKLHTVLGALLALTCTACTPLPPAVPVEVPFGLGRGDESVEFDFRVKETYGYVVHLKIFFYKKGDWEEWKKLDPLMGDRPAADGSLRNVGVPITLRIRVKSIEVEGPPVDFDRTTDQIGFIDASKEYATKRVQMRINDQKLLPGTYRIRVDNQHPVPEFADRRVHVSVNHAEQGK
jgi:hypothetical protein